MQQVSSIWRSRGGALRSAAALAAFVLLPIAVASPIGAALQPGFDQAFVGSVGGRTRAWGVAIADFTGDGIPDLISGDTFGDVHLLEGGGDGIFFDRGVVINMTFHDAYALVAADFDSDGFQDFALSRTQGGAVNADDGMVLLYLGNGDGTFRSTGFPQLGEPVGDAGTDVMTLAAGDVDGDGDVDLLAGDVAASENDRADVILFRNQLDVIGGALAWVPETVISATDRGFSPDPEDPPYFPPTIYQHAFGLALGDVDGDGDPDLLVSDRANYLYIYENIGGGLFEPIRFEHVAGRPFAYDRLHLNFTFQMPIASGDLNGDGLIDFATTVQTGGGGSFLGAVEVWVNEGLDSFDRPMFSSGGVVGTAGRDARGLAVGQLDPLQDRAADVLFGNFEGDLYGLFADLTDSDGDGIIDSFDNAPSTYNPPVLDMNTDGSLNRWDQLDNDADGVGDPEDPDDDGDGIVDESDNCRFSPNPAQHDLDGDGLGDPCDPLNDSDSDEDGVRDGPLDATLLERAVAAKARWASGDTHFVVRIDALGRVFQNEFTQIMTDAAVMDPAEWEARKFDSYNSIGDAPALPGYQVPADLPGGMDVPLSVVVIPKQIFDAYGDPDPIDWINTRLALPNLELAQHGTYHTNNTPLGDWASQPDRNFYSCETCGFPADVMFQYLRVGRRTLLGDYAADPWILQSGADETSPRIDWTAAANPLISYAPPFNTSDTESREAVCHLGMASFSASVFEEESPIFAPEGSSHETFDAFGVFHVSADRQVDPDAPAGMDYADYLASITEWGGLNTWLIEEVEWSTRYCNDVERLESCPLAPGGVNRENNMVDPERWSRWLILLDFVKNNGVPMTMGEYALAMATDNCPGIPNFGQADHDADGIGDPCDVDRIDVKPGSDENPIQPGSHGVIPVAIPGSAYLQVRDIAPDSLRFGPNRAAPARRARIEDVDGDGFDDLVAHFRTQETGIQPGMTSGCMEGTVGATAFFACDAIVTVPVTGESSNRTAISRTRAARAREESGERFHPRRD